MTRKWRGKCYSLLLLALCFINQSNGFLQHCPSPWSPSSFHSRRIIHVNGLKESANSGEKGNVDDLKINRNKEDWRSFRAKLVQEEKGSTIADSKWTYDAGMLIEKGSLVVSKVEDSLGCHDLRQPYFAKCVILLLEHDESEFTQGIILNRPSNLNLKDQDIVYYDDDGEPVFEENSTTSDNHSWRMFFGGDIAGLYDESPLIVCLHNDTSEMAQSVSDEILPGVFLTSHLGARALVDEGNLDPEACFTFYGFCGWDPGQLERELKRDSWSIVSVDSDTLWSDLARLRQPDNDPREVGLEMWQRIMGELDKQQNGKEKDKDPTLERDRQAVSEFQDLMLKEWATQVLMVPQVEQDETYVEDNDIFQAIRAAGQTPQIQVGSLLQGSSQGESPFLLQDQFLHKSTILLLQDSDAVSIAVALNLPSSDAIEVELTDGTTVVFPIRYGGPDGRDDEDPLLWFYYGPQQVGQALGPDNRGGCIQSCSYEQVVDSLENGVAISPRDFLVVQGFCLWQKGEQGSGGIKGQVIDGKFETVSSHKVSDVLFHLGSQKLITEETFQTNFQLILNAWKEGVGDNSDDNKGSNSRLVFDSHMEVSELADKALWAWIKIFLLENEEYLR